MIIDYLWGRPTEVLLGAMTRADFNRAHASRTRLVQVGESAAPTITLPAAALRSSSVEILGAGSGSMPALEYIRNVHDQLMARATIGELCVDTERVPLAEIEKVWQRENPSRRRFVIIP